MKNILYVHMDFYQYDERIINELESRQYNVVPFFDKNHRTLFSRAILRINRKSKISKKHNHNYQMRFLDNIVKKYNDFEKVIIIVGRYLCEDFYKRLKESYPNTEMILYLWDDISRVPGFDWQLKYFDKVFSFDKVDCEKHHLKFLPLFFVRDFVYEDEEKKYLLFSSGIDHSNRVQMINELINQFSKESTFFYIFSSPFLVFKRNLKRHKISLKKESFIHYHRASLNEIALWTKQSKCLVDIQYVEQNGLSMRTMESLAAKCKLITTNKSVKYYDFYNPNNILIIDRNEDLTSSILNFLNSDYVKIDEIIIDNYSLKKWVDTILGIYYGN